MSTPKHFLPVLSFLLVFSSQVFSQEREDNWNKNYQEVSPIQILRDEYAYADSVNKHVKTGKYYFRNGKYRFYATYTGKIQPISKERHESMERVMGLFKVNPKVIEGIKNEMLFLINGHEIWMPVQEVLVKPMKKETGKKKQVYLYCLFLNEHTTEGDVYNLFLVSEFRDRP